MQLTTRVILESAEAALGQVVLARPRLPVAVTIGDRNAEVVYAGAVPGLIAGVLRVGANSSPAGVTVAIQP